MQPAEKIKTVKDEKEAKFKEKGSLFIAKVFPLQKEEQTAEIISKIKKEYFDATHHCFAYRIMPSLTRYSDDGEPQGTAGLRILQAIDHFGLTNILLVVIRYFGGTKLGVGPLGKAYYTASEMVLASADLIDKQLFKSVSIEADFKFLSQLYRILSNYEGKIVESHYDRKIKIDALIKVSNYNEVSALLTNLLKGEIIISEGNNLIYL